MSSDRTRNSHDPRQKYESLVFQAGRVLVDPDLTEAQDLLDGTIDANTLDIIGPHGSPDDGFKIFDATLSGSTSTFKIHHGTMYVGGERLTLDEDTDYFGKEQSGETPKLVGQKHLDWVTIENEIANPKNKIEHVYLHVLEKEVGAVEDQALKEVALGGPDTSNRKRLIQRVKRLTVGSTECDQGWRSVQDHYIKQGYKFDLAFDPDKPNKPLIDPRTMLLNPNASLKVGFTNDEIEGKPCEPEAHGGYLGAENQMIRVKVVNYDPNTETGSILWSYDNASHIYRVTPEDDGTGSFTRLTLSEKPVDTFHWLKKDQAVELLKTGVLLANGYYATEHIGVIGIIDEGYDVESESVTLTTAHNNTDYPSADTDPPVFMRVWNEQIDIDLSTGQATAVLGESGVEVTIGFERNLPLPIGVFWMFAVRPATPNDIYPHKYKDAPQEPEGPREWIAPLATINWNVAKPVPTDCRGKFVPLTEVLSMQFVAGESQEVMPNPQSSGSFLILPVKPKVGVLHSKWPVEGAKVKFSADSGQIISPFIVTTDADGFAECDWQVDSTTDVQHLHAELLGDDGNPTHLKLTFTVQLSRAGLVAYDPGACSRFNGSVTVQDAIDDLCVIPASTVTFDPRNCSHVTSKNVQDAIDELCRRESSGCCTIHVSPEDAPKLQAIIDHAAEQRKNKDQVSVCFGPGVYRLENPLVITERHSNFTFEGCPGGVYLKPSSAKSNFLLGLVYVVQASNITFLNLHFLPKAIPIHFAGTISVRFATGLNVQQCVSLTVRQCVFEYPPQSDYVFLRYTGLEISGEQEFLVIEECSFVQERLEVFSNLVPIYYKTITGISAITTMNTHSGGSVAVVFTMLDKCKITNNDFYGLTNAASLEVGFGALQIVGNRVRDCYSGFAVTDVHAAQVKQAVLTSSVPASIQDAVKDKLSAFLSEDQHGQTMVALEIAKQLPLHTSFDFKGQPVVTVEDLDKDTVISKKIAQSLTDSLIQPELDAIPKSSRAKKTTSVSEFAKVKIEKQERLDPEISDLKLRNDRILNKVFSEGQFVWSKAANLYVSGNEFKCIVGSDKLSARCMDFQSPLNVPSTIRIEGNSLINRSTNSPTLAVSAFKYVTMTGNQVTNELSNVSTSPTVFFAQGWSLVLHLTSGSTTPSMLAVTGNCFYGLTNLAWHPRPGYTTADGRLRTWQFANHLEV